MSELAPSMASQGHGFVRKGLNSVVEKFFKHVELPLIRRGLDFASLGATSGFAVPFFSVDGEETWARTKISYVQYGTGPRMWAQVIEPMQEEDVQGVVVFTHGGGFVATDAPVYMHSLDHLVRRGFVVVGVEFPLAPDAPFPICEFAILQAIQLISKTWSAACSGPYGLVLLGESAGGSLALTLAARLTNPACLEELKQAGKRAGLPASTLEAANGPLPSVTSVVSLSGMLSRRLCVGADAMSTAFRALFRWYEPTGQELATFEDLLEKGLVKKMPRTMLGCGSDDFLVQHSVRTAKLMQQQALPVQLEIYKNCSHGFTSFATIISSTSGLWLPQAKQFAVDFLAFATDSPKMALKTRPFCSWSQRLRCLIRDVRCVILLSSVASFITVGNSSLFLMLVYLARKLLARMQLSLTTGTNSSLQHKVRRWVADSLAVGSAPSIVSRLALFGASMGKTGSH